MAAWWTDVYAARFSQMFDGGPVARWGFRPEWPGPELDICAFPAASGGRVFCSLGLTHYAGQLGEIAEVMLSVERGWESTPALLARTLFRAVEERVALRPGLALECAEEVRPGIGRRGLYLSLPEVPLRRLCSVHHAGWTGWILRASLISAQDGAYLLRHGRGSFEALLARRPERRLTT